MVNKEDLDALLLYVNAYTLEISLVDEQVTRGLMLDGLARRWEQASPAG